MVTHYQIKKTNIINSSYVTRLNTTNKLQVYFLCFMENNLDKFEEKVIEKLFKLAVEKFEGNNSLFARKSNCSEASIRRIYSGKQRMTFNMLLKLCSGLEIDIKELFTGLSSDTELS